MSKLKSFLDQIKKPFRCASTRVCSTATQVKTHIGDNKDEWRESTLRHVSKGRKATETFAREGLKKTTEQAKAIYVSAKYSKTKLKQLENNIENQGAAYRELQRDRTLLDTLFLGVSPWRRFFPVQQRFQMRLKRLLQPHIRRWRPMSGSLTMLGLWMTLR